MQCAVYKCHRKQDTYLYVEREDDFKRVPESLRQLLGELTLVLALDLAEIHKLANADIRQVKTDLQDKGFYLQLPQDDRNEFAGHG